MAIARGDQVPVNGSPLPLPCLELSGLNACLRSLQGGFTEFGEKGLSQDSHPWKAQPQDEIQRTHSVGLKWRRMLLYQKQSEAHKCVEWRQVFR